VNPLELLKDPNVSDILIDGHRDILIEVNGELQSSGIQFESNELTHSFAKELLLNTNVRFDLNMPFGEANIETEYGRLRVHCVHGGECSENTLISIRRHPTSHISINELQQKGFMDGQQLSELQEIISSRKNFVIIGATGTGKTTLLRAMLNELRNERIVTIEDSAELNLHGRSVSLFTRARNQDGFGEIGLGELVRQSLRMRPDRIVIGEARGEELKVLLNALNTGHQGAGFTLHANGIKDVITRLRAILASAGLERMLSDQMIQSSIDFVIEVRKVDGARRLMGIRATGELYE